MLFLSADTQKKKNSTTPLLSVYYTVKKHKGTTWRYGATAATSNVAAIKKKCDGCYARNAPRSAFTIFVRISRSNIPLLMSVAHLTEFKDVPQYKISGFGKKKKKRKEET